MRPGQGEAGEDALSTGASRSSRGGHPRAWRHSAPACLLCPHGRGAGTPLGWGGVGASHMFGPRQDPALETQSLYPKDCSVSHCGSLGGAGGPGGAGGAPESQAWLGHQREAARREPQAFGDLVSSHLFLSLRTSQLGLCLSSSLSLGDSGVKEFAVGWEWLFPTSAGDPAASFALSQTSSL